MSHPNSDAKSLTKIRTYAMDLDAVRNQHNPKDTKAENPAPVSTITKEVIGEETFKAPISKIVTPKKVVTVINKKPIGLNIDSATPALKPIPSSLSESISSINNKKSIIVDNDEGAAATIITDTKRNRFKLIPAVIGSIKKWFEKEKKSLTAKKTPRYSVPDSSLRKGVIQKATSKTGRFATADFDSIQERIKKRNEIIEDKPEVEGSTIWTPHTETGFFLLEAPEKTPVTNVKIESRKSFTAPIPNEPQPTAPILEVKPIVEVETAVEEADNRWSNPEVIKPEVTEVVLPSESVIEELKITSEPAEVIVEETPIVQNETWEMTDNDEGVEQTPEELSKDNLPDAEFKIPVTVIKEEETESKVPWYLQRDFWLSTNILTLLVATMTVLFIAVGTVMLLNQKAASTAELPVTEAILKGSNVEIIKVSNLDLESLTLAFTNAEGKVNKTTEIVPTIDKVEISATNVFSLLFPNADISFVHSVKKIHLGYSEQQVPFIVFDFTDKRAVFGGMLVWEHTITKDLSTLLGNNEDSSNGFADGKNNQIDIRFITDAGQDILVYAIVDNSVIITTDRLTLESLITLTK